MIKTKRFTSNTGANAYIKISAQSVMLTVENPYATDKNNPDLIINCEPYKSERSAKIAMTKLLHKGLGDKWELISEL